MGQEKTFYLAIFDIDSIFGPDKAKPLAKVMGLKKISLANKDNYKEILRSDQYNGSIFSLLFDSQLKEKKIAEVWIDETLCKDLKVNFSPIRNDAKITLDYEIMEKFITKLGYEIKVIPADKKNK